MSKDLLYLTMYVEAVNCQFNLNVFKFSTSRRRFFFFLWTESGHEKSGVAKRFLTRCHYHCEEYPGIISLIEIHWVTENIEK